MEFLPLGYRVWSFPPEHRSVMQTALATYLTDFYSDPAPGHQLAAERPRRDVGRFVQPHTADAIPD